jgi:hypothetical protein
MSMARLWQIRWKEGRHNYGISFDISRRLKEAKANSARKEANKALRVEKVMNKKTNKETRKTKRKKMKKEIRKTKRKKMKKGMKNK